MKLVIDLAKCQTQEQAQMRCSYPGHPENKGIDTLLEQVRFALVCRHCEASPCVKACPQGALEKAPTQNGTYGQLQRAHMLCTGCGTCSMACPFGTILPDLVLFPSSVCDLCKDRLQPEEKPLCVETCPDDSVTYESINVDPDHVEVFDDLVVRIKDGCVWKPDKLSSKSKA